MNADVLTTKVADGIAVITLGSPKRIYFDAEMGDALTETLDGFAGDPNIGARTKPFLKLCISEAGLARMRSYEEKKITSPSRSFEV
jgi:hypothetical protein